jgi:hypothetical protein
MDSEELNIAVANEAIAENKVYMLEKQLKQANEHLNESNKIIRQQQLLDEENLMLKNRIKRLEEALEGTVKWIVDLANSGDAGFWYVDEQPEIIAARAALKKEIKQ